LPTGPAHAITTLMSKRRTSAPEALPPTPAPPAEGEGRFHISRYHSSRNFALYDGENLVAVTVYRKGAEAIRERLEADAKTIEDLQRRIAERPALAVYFREQATATPRPSEQLPLLAAEDMPAYRVTSPRRPSPRR
jgi:hypothetical protein